MRRAIPVFVALAVAACGGSKGKDKAAAQPRAVKTARAAEVQLGRSVVVSGTLAAHNRATVATKVPGRLQVLNVDLGSRVEKGQILAQVAPTDYALRVQQAEAALAEARARIGLGPGEEDRVDPQQTGTVRQAAAVLEEARQSRERSARLASEGLIAQAERDASEAAYKVAESRYQDALDEIRGRSATAGQRRVDLAVAQQQLSDTSVKAPFAGVVEQKRANVGEYMAAGAPLLDLVSVDPLRFKAEVPERDAGSVRAGQGVRVSAEGVTREYAGTIARLSPTISERNRVLVVEADIPNDGGLRPGTFVRAQIVTDATSRGVTIPSRALVTFAGIQKVFLVREGKAVEKAVTAGQRTDEWTEIASGVSAGDEVVVDPGNLRTGEAVASSEMPAEPAHAASAAADR
ncbi:MAG: efflux RND transporter periplasmic adaptor subunit [Vicinamibacteria bacterium]